MGKSQKLYLKAKTLIPGGTQLLSKRPEMHLPDLWPAYYDKAKGCQVWDLDGKKYLDMSLMAVGACILGYADPDVDKAVIEAVKKGSMNTLNAPEEVELAELLCKLHPWAEMVRYARCGGEAMAIAVRIARAASGKDKVLFCGYHGWHDWYLSANLADDQALDGHLLKGLSPQGVPRALKGTALPFQYNDTAGFLKLIEQHKNEIGVVVMEPIRNDEPNLEFLTAIRETTRKLGIVLVIDEVTAGWRMNMGGAHLNYNFIPDIAVFGKAMSNGYPMAAIIGNKKVMEAAQTSFISSTYWTDRVGPVAALATLKKLQKQKVPQHLIKIGQLVQKGWAKAAKQNQLKLDIGGIFPLSHFGFEYENALVLKTLFTQLMLERGYMAGTGLYVSYAHKEKDLKLYLKAVDEVFGVIKKALDKNQVEKMLKGPVCHAGFKRLN